MGTNWPKPGINHIGEFQASGHTLVVTGSSNRISLKYVASGITFTNTKNYVTNDANNLSLSIYDCNHQQTTFTLRPGSTANYKGKFLTFQVPTNMDALVSITNIPSASYVPPSGSMLHKIL